MATRQKTVPISEGHIDEALAERAERRRLAGHDCADDVLGSYLADAGEEFLARFRKAQEALASKDPERLRELGDEARRAEAEAILATYPDQDGH